MFGHRWTDYDHLAHSVVATAYQSYLAGTGPSTVSVTFPGRPETYQLDFINCTQTNLTSATERYIRPK